MPVFHIDFENFFDEKAGISLSKMALRKYLEVAPVIGFSVAIDHSAPTWIPADSEDFLPALAEIDEALQQPGNILNAYNVPFDSRVLCFGRLEAHGEPFGCRWPIQIRDTMEMAMGAWPNTPGGYSLRNVAAWLGLPPKLSMSDVFKKLCTWEAYCNRDTELLQAIYYRALSRLPEDELYYSENCNRVRGLAYSIREDTVKASLDAFTKNTEAGVAAAVSFLSGYSRDGEDLGGAIFGGYTEGKVRSVKAKALKELLIGALGFDTTSTSLKKINPVHLAGRPDVNTLLQATSKANKGLYYQKRATALLGSTEIDMEKGYFRATNTGRTSAPTTGRGVNTANLSKKDKTIAKPLRQMLALPDDMCYVRADAANVEYRCLLAGTPVLTNNGWKGIETVTNVDLVWDGLEWVSQGGAVCQGNRDVIWVHGVGMTPDHPVLSPEGWAAAEQVATSAFPSLGQYSAGGQLLVDMNATLGDGTAQRYAASAEGWRASLQPTSYVGSPGNAVPARLNAAGASPVSSPMTPCAPLWYPGTRTSSPDATTRTVSTSTTTAVEGSPSTPPSKTGRTGYATPSRSPGTTTPLSPSTGSTSTGATPPAISASPHGQSRTLTSGPVYDLLDCGPRHQFQAGALIVHNCEAWLTDCTYVRRMFEKDINADPYSAFAKSAFGVDCKKGDPMRDVVAKAAVLGYGFMMGTIRAIEELNKAVADPINKVSVAQIEALCNERGWKPPSSRYLKGATTRVGCHWSVAVAANESREAFHGLHPEFGATADWLQRSVEMLAASKDPERIIDRLYEMSGAPNRNLLELCIDKELEFPTVRVRLFGHSMPTVTWRHLSCSHPGIDGLGAVTANKGPRNVHRALLIENCVQSAARLGLVRCENELARRGWITDSVYDEILILCKRDRETVLRARADLIDVMSPTGPHSMGWAFYGKPGDMTVTKTRYESEEEAAIAWKKLETNDPTWTEHLT